MPKRRRYPRFGEVVAIPLRGGDYAFAQALEPPELAFFDLRSAERASPDEVVSHPVLFRLWVMRYGPLDWEKLGKAAVAGPLQQEVPRFKKDPTDGALRIYVDAEERPATIEEVRHLEAAAVWEPEHVVDRLEDHFAGRPNKWVEALRP